MDYVNPKSPSDLSKPERLRRQAKELKRRAERFLEEADVQVAEAERLEKESNRRKSPKTHPKENFNQAAFRAVQDTIRRSES